jgi:hypothetical protein
LRPNGENMKTRRIESRFEQVMPPCLRC